MLPVLHIGPIAVQTPGLVMLLGIWLGLTLTDRFAGKFEIKTADLDRLALIALTALVLGGRLVYAARHLNSFIAAPASLISPNLDLWDPLGGYLTVIVACGWYIRRHSLNLARLLDSLVPALAVGMVAWGLSHLAAGTAYGAPAHLPWSIFLDGEWRHPSQVYETTGALLTLTGLVIYLLRLKLHRLEMVPGRFFLLWVAWNAALRLFLEAFRGDSALIGPFRTAQVAAWIILAACLVLLGRNSQTSTL
jgi:phosphatidylglycerol---prolipoprotein diacylglyceryl transferase